MGQYSKKCLETFLKEQGQLFDEPVAETLEETEDFLDMCMAVVVKDLKEVKAYFKEVGTDIEQENLEEVSEVFRIPGEGYLIVEG